MRLKFFKISGAGNDFVLLFKPPRTLRGSKLAVQLCHRQRSIGADGLLILDEKNGLTSVSYFNADGSAAFCGNGTRCAAWWLHNQRIKGRKFTLKTIAGIMSAEITGAHRAAIQMPSPRVAKFGIKILTAGQSHTAHWINTGSPHAVIETKNLHSAPVNRVGPLLRRHKVFGRAGANIDFANFDKNRIALRTFEKGVEAETLSCGTGAVAAACVGRALGRVHGNSIRVLTAGKGILNVLFKNSKSGRDEVWLEGPVTPIFSGEINLCP